MKAFEMRTYEGIDSLALVERPKPTPRHKQVLVRIRAASLNYRDLLIVGGNYSRNLPLPLVPLSDGAGKARSSLIVRVTVWQYRIVSLYTIVSTILLCFYNRL